jgi:peptidoglycan/LPS O-acetylase OafA/YrhL
LPYQPALDGLRALAVLAVLLFHARVPGAAGGFIGVDVFFVLSGYLITTLLLAEHSARGAVDLPGFWGRRVRRLCPALILFVGVYLAVGGLLFSAGASRQARAGRAARSH